MLCRVGQRVCRWDLCAGPHVETTGSIDPNAFELESVAGAYWRGDENNAMLQVCFGLWEGQGVCVGEGVAVVRGLRLPPFASVCLLTTTTTTTTPSPPQTPTAHLWYRVGVT